MSGDTVAGATAGASRADPAAAGSPAAASLAAQTHRLMACVHCGFCLDACPTYTRIGDESDSPRGRLYLMRAVAEGRLPPESDALRVHLDRCLGCRACEPVCPSGVEYGFLLERGRETIARARGIPLLERILLATFGTPSLNAIAGFFARLIRASGMAALAVRIVPGRFRRVRMAAAMLEASRPWKALASSTASRDRGGTHDRVATAASDGATGSRVAVFEGCVQKTLFARVNAATRSLMEHNGHTVVDVKGLRCCGALHAHAGDLDGARALARHNLAVLGHLVSVPGSAGSQTREGAGPRVDAIIVNAAGCGAMMQEYGRLFEGQPEHELAAAVASRVLDPLIFLARHGVRAAAADCSVIRAAWDSPCHLIHGQRAGGTPLEIVRAALPGAEIVPVPRSDECCGGAGIHALVHSAGEDRVLSDKITAVRSVAAGIVLTGNPGCIMQIGGGLLLHGEKGRAVHPVELMNAQLQ